MDPDYTHPLSVHQTIHIHMELDDWLNDWSALQRYWAIDWMIDVRCLQLFPLFSEKPFYLRSLIFFHTEY